MVRFSSKREKIKENGSKNGTKNGTKSILLIVEGDTEENYFEGLKVEYLSKLFSDIRLVLVNIGGKVEEFEKKIQIQRASNIIIGVIGIFDLDAIIRNGKDIFVKKYLKGKSNAIHTRLLLTYPNMEAWILGHFSDDFFQTKEADIEKKVRNKLSPGNDKYKSDPKIYEKIQSKMNYSKYNVGKTVFHVAKENFEKKNNGRVYADPLNGNIYEDMKNTIHSSLIYLEDCITEINDSSKSSHNN